MTIRRLSQLLSVIAIALAGIFLYIRPDPTVATCLNHGQASEIITACTALIENPDIDADALPVYLDKRAWAARRVLDFEMAMADITRALDLRPDTPLLWVGKAFINNAQGAFDAADADFEQALALEPENLFTIMDSAVIYTGRGAYAEALQYYERAMQIDPNSKRAMRGVIRSTRSMKLYDLALEWLNKAAQQWPDDAVFARVQGAIQYLYLQDYQAALLSYEAAARLDPAYQLNLLYLGATNLKLEKTDLGKSYIEQHAAQFAQRGKDGSLYWRAIALFANLTQLAGDPEFYSQGASYAIIGQPELSRVAFQRYLDSGGSNAMQIMQRLLANYYECAGASCEGRGDEGYEAALSRYLDAVGNTFSLDNY